jgi:uncharacterized protein YlxP (DUF503 family)
MIIATCKITLQLDGVSSLKEKRRILKSVLSKLRQKFALSAAEVAYQDVWQTAQIGLALVGNDGRFLESVLAHAVQWLEEARPDVPISEIETELIHC